MINPQKIIKRIANIRNFSFAKTDKFPVIVDSSTDVTHENDEDSPNRSRQLFQEGELCFQQENFNEAEKKYLELLNSKRSRSDLLTFVTASYNLAAISLKTDQIKEAQKRLYESERLLKQASTEKRTQNLEFDLNLGRVLSAQAFCLRRLGAKPNVVVQKYKEALQVLRDVSSNSFDYQIEIAEILLSIVIIERQENQNKDVKTRLEEALIIIDGLDGSSDEYRFASVYVEARQLLAAFFQEENQYFFVEKNNLEAEAMLLKSNLPHLNQKKFEINFDLGDLYFKTQRYQEAERRYSQALEYNGTVPDARNFRAQLLRKQILCYAALEKDDEVEKKAFEILKYLKEKEDNSNENFRLIGDVCLLQALAYKNLGKLDASKKVCRDALTYFSKAFVSAPELLPRYQLAFKLKFELESQRVVSSQTRALRQKFEKALANPIDDSNLICALENYARALFQEQNFDEVQEACVKTLGIFELTDQDNSNSVVRVNKILLSSDALRFYRNARVQDVEEIETKEVARQIYTKLNLEHNPEETTKEYFQLVSQCVNNKKIELAKRYCKLAIDSFERTSPEFQKEHIRTIALYYLSVGEYQKQNNLLQDAYESFVKFSECYERLKEKQDLEPGYLTKILAAYCFIAQREPSQENERKALAFFNSIGSDIQTQFLKDAAAINRALADQLYVEQKYDEALTEYNRTSQLFYRLEQIAPNNLQKREIASILNVIGSLYFRAQKYDDAKSYYKQAWKISKTLVDVQTLDSLFEPLHNLTCFYEKENELAKAWKYNEEALQILDNLQDANARAVIKHKLIVLNRLSLIVYKMGIISKAYELNRRALEITRKLTTLDNTPDVFQTILFESSYLLKKVLGDSSKKESCNDLTSFLYKPNETALRSCCVSFLRTKKFTLTVPTDRQIKRFEKRYKEWLIRQSKKNQKRRPNSQLIILTSLTNSYERSILNITAQNSQRFSNIAVVVVLPMSKEAFKQIYNYPNFTDDLRQATKIQTLPLPKTTQQTTSLTNNEGCFIDISNPDTKRQIDAQHDYLTYYMFQQSLNFLHWNGKKIKSVSEKRKNKYFNALLNKRDDR